MSKTRFINPEALGKPPGYTHVVEATTPGRLVYIAGQLGVDRDGHVVGDFRAQAAQTFENLKHALEAVGGRFEDVVKLNSYLVGINHLPVLREVRDRYLPAQNRPASTTLAIAALARDGALLEIEAVAVLLAPARAKSAARTGGRGAAKKRVSPAKKRVTPRRKRA